MDLAAHPGFAFDAFDRNAEVNAALLAAGRSRAWLDAVDDATWSVWRR